MHLFAPCLKKTALLTLCIVSAQLPSLFAQAPPANLYVDASATSGDNNGTDWANAYLTLQSALATSPPDSEIHVAQGTYYPDEGTGQTDNDRTSTFQLLNGVIIFGGYPAGGGSEQERDPTANETILSGDLQQDDVSEPGIDDLSSLSDNAYHVVTGTGTNSTARLIGFTIKRGHANVEAGRHHLGAGLVCDFSGDPWLESVIIEENFASLVGGGAYLNEGDPRFFKVEFRNNFTTTDGSGVAGEGGAIYFNLSNATLTSSSFTGNQALSNGGALSLHGSSPTIFNCTFANNHSEVSGGAAYAVDASEPDFEECVFNRNSATGNGGAIWASGTAPSITQSTFNENVAAVGGAIASSASTSLSVSNSIFRANRASTRGGAIDHLNASTPTLTNSVLQGNRSEGTGGAIAHTDTTNSSILNCSLQGNRADIAGGSIFNGLSSGLLITNTIIWNNVEDVFSETIGASIANSNSISPVFKNSLIANSGGSANWNNGIGSDSGGNLDTDPLFKKSVDPFRAPILGGILQLRLHSPAINAGEDTANNTDTDLAEKHRIQGSIDIGAYEHGPNRVIYVDRNATGANTGDSWENAISFLQDALNVAENFDHIYVAHGTYYPDEGDLAAIMAGAERESKFIIPSDVTVLGGFPTGGSAIGQRDIEANETILSGDLDQDDGPDFANRSDNAYNVILFPEESSGNQINGFTITGGNANNDNSSLFNSGGGVHVEISASPTLSNSTFRENQAIGGGAIALSILSSTSIEHCRFQDNLGISFGGAISASGFSDSKIFHSDFMENESVNGGAIFIQQNTDVQFTSCSFDGNNATLSGGAIYNTFGNFEAVNCSFSGNYTGGGGAVYNLGSSPAIINCSFQGNSSSGGVIFNISGSTPTISNSVFWNNLNRSGNSNPSVSNSEDSTASLSYCLVAESGGSSSWDTNVGIDLGNNIDADPLFALETNPQDAPTTGADLSLQEGSPAFDVGLNAVNLERFDLAMNRRIHKDTIDLGAYEKNLNTFEFNFLGLDPDGDENRNGITNYIDYANGADPTRPHESNTTTGFSKGPDGSTLIFTQRIGVDDVFASWQKSTDLSPDSWMPLIEDQDYSILSEVESDGVKRSVVELINQTSRETFYRQAFVQQQ